MSSKHEDKEMPQTIKVASLIAFDPAQVDAYGTTTDPPLMLMTSPVM